MSNKEKVVDLETVSMIKNGWAMKVNYSMVIGTPTKKILESLKSIKDDQETGEKTEELSVAAVLMKTFHGEMFKEKNDLFFLTSHNNPRDINIFNIETQKFIGYVSCNGFFGEEFHQSPMINTEPNPAGAVSFELYLNDRLPIVVVIPGIINLRPMDQISFFILAFVSSMIVPSMSSHNKLSDALLDCATIVNLEKITNVEL